jgi:hypothetical protein
LSSNYKQVNEVLRPYSRLAMFSLCTSSTSRLPGHLKERGHLEDLDLKNRIILKQIFKKQGGSLCTGLV